MKEVQCTPHAYEPIVWKAQTWRVSWPTWTSTSSKPTTQRLQVIWVLQISSRTWPLDGQIHQSVTCHSKSDWQTSHCSTIISQPSKLCLNLILQVFRSTIWFYCLFRIYFLVGYLLNKSMLCLMRLIHHVVHMYIKKEKKKRKKKEEDLLD